MVDILSSLSLQFQRRREQSRAHTQQILSHNLFIVKQTSTPPFFSSNFILFNIMRVFLGATVVVATRRGENQSEGMGSVIVSKRGWGGKGISIPEAGSKLALSDDVPGLQCPKGWVEVRSRGRIGGSSGPSTAVVSELGGMRTLSYLAMF